MRTTLAYLAVIALAAVGSPATAADALERPTKWSDRVDNPWFPLIAGTTFIYTGAEDGKAIRDVLRVTHRTRVIEGVRCTVLDDRLYVSGRLAERTTDWSAQDAGGTVWYFGEATAELDARGRVESREGSWQSGVGGARAGIYMPADPRVGQTFRQELYPGHAEDRFRVLSLRARVSVPYVSSRRALLTKEWTPLEPDVVDHKLYVRGVGMVEEKAVAGGDERLRLVAVRR